MIVPLSELFGFSIDPRKCGYVEAFSETVNGHVILRVSPDDENNPDGSLIAIPLTEFDAADPKEGITSFCDALQIGVPIEAHFELTGQAVLANGHSVPVCEIKFHCGTSPVPWIQSNFIDEPIPSA